MQIDFDRAWRQTQVLVNDVIRSVPNVLLALIVFFLFLFIGRYAARFTRVLVTRAHQAPGVGILLGRLVKYFTVVLGVLVALSVVFPSFRASDLIQVLGIGGIAVGFAFKDIFQNFLAGILILIARPFRIGDQIVVRDIEGTVEEIQTRATIVRTYDNRKVVIPNSTVYTENVVVLTAYSKRRVEIHVMVNATEDVEHVKETMMRVLDKVELVEKDPAPQIFLLDIADGSLRLQVWWWTAAPFSRILVTRDQVLSELKVEFGQAGIDLPLPTQVVVLQDQQQGPPEEKFA